MATVHVVLAHVKGRALTGSTMPVPDSVPIADETMTSSDTSTQSAVVAPSADSFWLVTVTGGDVRAAMGDDPDAGVDAGWLLLDGAQNEAFAVHAAGEKIAIKDA
jgi:hypothetical protein